MQSIQNIVIEWAVLHTADSSFDAPSLATEPISMENDDLRTYFEEHIKHCVKSTQLRMGKFPNPEGLVNSSCLRMITEGHDCFTDVSEAIAWWLQKQVAKESGVTVDLAVVPFRDIDTDGRYIALLKLDPMRVFLRKETEAGIFEQMLVLPNASHGLSTWAIVRTYDEEARYDLIYRASAEDDFWTPDFLECDELSTPRQMTKLVLAETAKWLDANAEVISPELAKNLAESVRESAQSDMMDLEELSERVIPNSLMRDNYISKMLDKGLTEMQFKPDSEWAERQSRKTTYVLDDGVSVAGPSDVIDDIVQILPKSDDGKTRLVIESKKFYQK